MAVGNRGFAQGLANAVPIPASGTRLPPRTGILNTRENRLAELASGASITLIHELVDPAICRIWEGHNRDYGALNEDNCGDLIESFKAERRQTLAAIVRRVASDADHTYEVICGARRHWTVSWMRLHGYPDFRFLIEPRELTDEEAFRIADLENRSRRDLSDYERACDYARAVEHYYGGSQQRMADRLEVTTSWLSRYLELARLPAEIVAAFGSPHVIGISHAAQLAPLLRMPLQRQRMTVEAQRLRDERVPDGTGTPPALPPVTVMRRLLAVAKEPAKPRQANTAKEHIVRSSEGSVVARGQPAGRGGGITISLPAPAKHDRAALIGAFEEIIDTISQRDRAARRGDR